ncbi:MAG: ArsR family transcriptional regulator [Acidobacteria bacterium OLB17]|nr:MAG: ArsR family transcriptional regulator [Acidobacteria bacterium OLB17]MCZ2389620.1 metalloregulator ArsR/SmtB family transcription factor [Acidobacteriota bacterium]
MDAFTAIAEPNRRKILELLATLGALAAGDIYQHFSMTPAAVSQHLKALKEAKLVRVEKRKQQRIYSLDRERLGELEAWVKRFTAKTEDAYSRLDVLLENEMKKLGENYGK